jgi:serine/threonine protein kinase
MTISVDAGAFHRNHCFTLPTRNTSVISPVTGSTYHFGGAIGEGSFGKVFYCTDDWGHELVAKVIKPFGDWNETEARATSEIVVQSLSRSPHAVYIYDAFVFQGAHYIVSERCLCSLRDMVANEKLDLHIWFKSLAKAVLHALSILHRQEIAHCDVHAGNVLLMRMPDALAPEDQAAFIFKLGDFGLARTFDNMRPEGTFPDNYLPPEVIDPEEFGPLDHRADIYQTGLLFLEVLTSKPLTFDRDDVLAGRPRELAESLPHPAGPVIATMLRRHSMARPSNALEVWNALSSIFRTQ